MCGHCRFRTSGVGGQLVKALFDVGTKIEVKTVLNGTNSE